MENDWRIITPFAAAFIGLFGWLGKHISNSKRHPDKTQLVYQDLCDERVRRFEDTIKEHKKDADKRHVELKADMNRGFDEVKQLIRANGH